MQNGCFLEMTFQVLHQSKQTFRGTSQRTWLRPRGLLSAHAQGHPPFLTRTSNLASSPLFSILADPKDPSVICERPELLWDYYSGSQLFGKTVWWWVSNINTVNGTPIRSPAPTLFITTDASKTEWGAVCENQRTNGRLSDS